MENGALHCLNDTDNEQQVMDDDEWYSRKVLHPLR